MINIYEYLLSKSNPKLNIIKATDKNIHQIVKDELDTLGHDADLNHIDVSKVTSMYNLFNCNGYGFLRNKIGDMSYGDLNPDISKWDVSSVKDMQYMFNGCERFNKDISGWDVSKVENMNCMFEGCEQFNCDISRWDVNNVKNYNRMFMYCKIKQEYKPHFKI